MTAGNPIPPSPRALRSTFPRRAILALGLLALAGCESTPSTPEGPPTVEVAFGDDQRGFAGEALPSPVGFRAVDAAGRPRAGVAVEVTTDGGGHVDPSSGLTGPTGFFETTWTLAPTARGTQLLEARIVGDPDAPATARARALGPDEADVVLVRGARGPLKGVLLANDTPEAFVLESARATADTLVELLPRDHGETRVLVLPTGNRPAMVDVAWTPGIDTAVVTLAPPVAIDVEVIVHVGPFDATRAVAEAHLAAAASAWEHEGAGVTLGRVRIVDRVEPGRRVDLKSDQVCTGSSPGGSVRVFYVHSINQGGFGGVGCLSGEVYMGENSGTWPYLLAHEIGHTFNLPHTSSGVMAPRIPGAALTEGEIFRLHFDQASVVNTIFEGQPAGQRRNCFLPSRCLAPPFELEER